MKNRNKRYNMTFDNLAIPEVNTGGAESDDGDKADGWDTDGRGEAITYDTVAIPEIHIKK